MIAPFLEIDRDCAPKNFAESRSRPVAKLVAQYGRRGNMSKWVSDLGADCPKRNATQLHERCDLICPDLPKVL